jgi:hypothetical protein
MLIKNNERNETEEKAHLESKPKHCPCWELNKKEE